MATRAKMRDVILCGTDFSDAAREAAEVAADLAVQHRRPLLLLHAASTDGKVTVADLQSRRERLKAEAARLASTGADIVTEVETAHADDVCRHAAPCRCPADRAGSTAPAQPRRLGSISSGPGGPRRRWSCARHAHCGSGPAGAGLRVFLAFDHGHRQAALAWWPTARPERAHHGQNQLAETRHAMGYPRTRPPANPSWCRRHRARLPPARRRCSAGPVIVVRRGAPTRCSSTGQRVAGRLSHERTINRASAPGDLRRRAACSTASASVAVVPAAHPRRLRRCELRRVLLATDCRRSATAPSRRAPLPPLAASSRPVRGPPARAPASRE